MSTMSAINIALLVLWLLASGGVISQAWQLRRANIKLAKRDPRACAYFAANAGAWESVAIEVYTALPRVLLAGVLSYAVPGLRLAMTIFAVVAMTLAGRIYEYARLAAANRAITNGDG